MKPDLAADYWPQRAILPQPTGLWIPTAASDPNATEALLLPVTANNRLIDLVAWRWDNPRQWWQRTGAATHLGDQWLDDPPDGATVPLSDTPADWLASRGKTLVILNWAADLAPILDGAPDILCQSTTMARRLIHALDGKAAVRILTGAPR